MHIEIINTGSELLLGSTINTHAAWMGAELAKVGLRVARQTTVPDGPAITDALSDAIKRSDVVFVTGGIGPTSDDICRECLAQTLNLPLVQDEVALTEISRYFEKINRPMAEANRKQALMPAGSEMLTNPHGTAPGIYSPPSLSGSAECAIFLLPGPPSEMRPMFLNHALPRIEPSISADGATRKHVTLRFTGIGESDFHSQLDTILNDLPDLEIGYCARPGEVDLRLIGSFSSVDSAVTLARNTFSTQYFTDQEESLEEVVVHALTKAKMTLALAESCTGGGIANRITHVSGASAIFTHGFVTYANEAKQEILHVPAQLLADHGAVSEPVALAMAEGALQVSGADIALSVTGIAGPTGGSEAKPVGTVWIALATATDSHAVHAFYPRGRDTFKRLVTQKALDLIRLHLLQ